MVKIKVRRLIHEPGYESVMGILRDFATGDGQQVIFQSGRCFRLFARAEHHLM